MSIERLKEFFGMKELPFANSIGAQFLYQNPAQNSITEKLALTVDTNSFALLTGTPGTGKSTILRRFVSALDKDKTRVLYVSLSNPTPRWLYTVPLEILGIKPHIYVNDARKQFHQELEIQLKTYGRKVVMIIDEAHLLTQSYRRFDMLEEIRFLLNGQQYDSGSPLSLILSGQTEILPLLQNERCKAITQRIMYICKTGPLADTQVGSYMAAHLRWAGVADSIFSSEAVEEIARLSGGNPRMINKICAHSLNYAVLKNEKTVTKEIVNQAANTEILEIMLKKEGG